MPLTIETMPIADLSEDPANVRTHGPKNLDAITASLRRFGQQKPIVVDGANIVRAGNGTLAAAKALGWESIDIVRTDLTNSDATAYAIADNRTGELAEWDEAELAVMLDRLSAEDSDLLEAAGYDEKELEELLAEFVLTPEIEEDEVPEPPDDPITQPGDLWILGQVVTCPKCGRDTDV